MLATLAHLFTPQHTNNHRPRILHPVGLSVLIGLYLISHASLKLLALYDNKLASGNILGYASNISVDDIVSLTNQERLNLGKASLTYNGVLSQAAAAKAANMFEYNYWAHNNPTTGQQPWDFIKSAGYVYRFAGENLARDFGDSPSVVAAWMASPSHRENIVSDRYGEIGVAVVNGQLEGVETTLVVQMFGTQASRQVVATAATTAPAASPRSEAETLSLSKGPSLAIAPVKTVQAQEGQGAPNPISPIVISKSVALSILIMLVITLIIDYVMINRRRVIRLSGKNLAHLLFITALIIVVLVSQAGGIL